MKRLKLLYKRKYSRKGAASLNREGKIPVLFSGAAFLCLDADPGSSIEVTAVGQEDSKDNGVCHADYCRQLCGLKIKMVKISGGIYYAGYGDISYGRQLFSLLHRWLRS